MSYESLFSQCRSILIQLSASGIVLTLGSIANSQSCGLTDSVHVNNAIFDSNAVGVTVGTAEYASPGIGSGTDAWHCINGSTTQIGLWSGIHTAMAPILRHSEPYQLSETSVDVTGISKIYGTNLTGTVDIETGQSAWIYDGTTTTRIALSTPDTTVSHLGNTYHHSQALALGSTSDVIGFSKTYGFPLSPNGAPIETGQQAWYFNEGTTTQVGVGGSHSTTDIIGNVISFDIPDLLIGEGMVSGHAKVYEEDIHGQAVETGVVPWFYHGGQNYELPHTFPPSSLVFFEEEQFDREPTASTAYFAYTVGNTRDTFAFNTDRVDQLGLLDGLHLADDGARTSHTFDLNGLGQVLGQSIQLGISGSDVKGFSAWLYNGVDTIPLGLRDSEHTLADGHSGHFASSLNEIGQVVGASLGNDSSRDVWLYDSSSGTTFEMPNVLGSMPWPEILTDEGIVGGTYVYDEPSGQKRLFYWRAGDVPQDPGGLMGSDYASGEWADFDYDEQTGEVTAYPIDTNLPAVTLQIPGYLPRPGEFDLDGDSDVDGSEFLKWQRGESINVLSQSDLALWHSQFGGPAQSSSLATKVPEANTLALLISYFAVSGVFRFCPRIQSFPSS